MFFMSTAKRISNLTSDVDLKASVHEVRSVHVNVTQIFDYQLGEDE
jgi:hypothetical protein